MGNTFFDVTNVTKNEKLPRDTLTAYESITRAPEFFVTFFLKNVTM